MSHIHLKTVLPAAILLGGFLLCTTASYGNPDYSKATDSLNTFADNLIRQFAVYTNPKQFQDQLPKEIAAYFNDAIPRK